MAHFDTQNEYKNRIVFPEVTWKTLDEDLGPVIEHCKMDVKRISNLLGRVARHVKKKELELAKRFYAKEFEQYNCTAGK